MRVFRRTSLALLLGLTLCASWASAADSRRVGHPQAAQGLAGTAGRLWSVLISLWSVAGCELDPLGLCSPAALRSAPADEGCELDPLGRCLPGGLRSAPADAGCRLDPLGRCLPDSQQQGLSAGGWRPAPADEGCRLDPLGCAASR